MFAVEAIADGGAAGGGGGFAIGLERVGGFVRGGRRVAGVRFAAIRATICEARFVELQLELFTTNDALFDRKRHSSLW